MPNMKSLSLTVQKFKRRLKLTTDRQTIKQIDRQTGQNNMSPIIPSGGIKSIHLRVFAGKTPVYEISILTCINLMQFPRATCNSA